MRELITGQCEILNLSNVIEAKINLLNKDLNKNGNIMTVFMLQNHSS